MSALTEVEYELLSYFEQVWLETGLLITQDKAAIDYGIPVELFKAAWNKPEFKRELDLRGITVKSAVNGEKWRLKALTELQLTAANVMMDFQDTRSQKKKLADLGVSTAQWQSWLKDRAFQDYLRQRAENILGDNTHEAHLALIDRVRSGDMSAIKYYNEITGRYVPTKDNNVNVQLILVRVLEIIQKYVQDVRVQDLIAQEFLGLATPEVPALSPGNVVNIVVGETVVEEPEVFTGPVDSGEM